MINYCPPSYTQSERGCKSIDIITLPLFSMLNSKIQWSLYLFLVILRFWGALYSQHGYIHPDEFFQGGQELFFGCQVLDSSFLQPRTSTTSPVGDKSYRGTGEEKDVEDIDYIVRNVPWEFEPKNALRSIVPPAFMTLLPLRFHSATTSEKLSVLMNGNPVDTSRSDLESIEGENEPSCPDVSSRQSSANSLSQLLMPSTAMQTLSGKEILIIPRIFMTFLSFLFLDLPLWIMVLVSQSNSAHAEKKPSIQSSGTNSDATTNENALHASERKTLQIATQNTFAPPIEVIILASSWPCLVFGVRPFTNNLEAMVLSFLLLAVFLEIANNRHGTLNNFITSITIGMSCAVGIFVRFTFAFYAFPAVLSFLWVRSKKANGHIIFNVLVNGTQMLCSFAITASMFIYIDTQYYSQQQEVDNMEMPPLDQHNEMIGDVNENLILKSYTKFIAPLNAFLYNSKSKNLAEHGLHPRITHAVVNMPMLFGPLALVGFASAFQTLLGGYRHRSSGHDTSIFRYICHWVIASGIFILSCAPHQEPRFLLPCLVPMVFLYGREAVGMERCDSMNAVGAAATIKAAAKGTKSKTNIIRSLRVVWVVFNLLLYLFFGWLHQGGLITSLRELPRIVSTSASRPEDVSRNNPLPVIIYYHTYMPPTFLTRQRGFSSYSCDKRDFNVDGTCFNELAWTKNNNGECGDSHSQSCGRHSILDLRGSDPKILSSLLRKLLPCTRDAQDVVDASSSGNEEMHIVYMVSPPVVVSSLQERGRKGLYNHLFRKLHGYGGHVSTEDWPIFHGSIKKFVKELELAVYEVHCWEE